MGTVRKQSIHSSLFMYVGFALGAVNMLLLPRILTTDQFGLTRVLISVCTLLAGLCSLGTQQVITRFYPYYDQGKGIGKGKHKTDLLGWALVVSMAGFCIMVVLTIVFKDLIIRKFEGNSPLFIDYFYLIYPFTFFILLFGIYERIAWSRQYATLSSFLRETGVRIFTLIIVLFLFFQWINANQFIILYSLQFGVVFIVIYGYLAVVKGSHFTLKISPTTRRLSRQMSTYAAFIIGGSLFSLVEQYFNTILLGSRESLSSAGIFDIASFIATFLLVPKRSIQAAASATIATALKNRNHEQIERVYKKSAATLLIAGLAILCLLWLNIDHIFDLYKPEYRAGKYVVLVIGIANLIDLATGLNYDILVNSRLWKLHFYLSILVIIIFLPVTYVLVRHYGIMGSAYGILISLFIYNALRCFLLWWKFKMQPFSLNTFLILAGGLLAYGVAAYLVPDVQNVFADILIKSAVFCLLFIPYILVGQFSEDINELYHLGLEKIGWKKKNRS